MNPLFATMENNSKMNNKKTNAKKKKNKSKTFLLYLFNNNVGQAEQRKGFLLGKFWIFSKFVLKV